MNKFILNAWLIILSFGMLFPKTNKQPFSLPLRVIANNQIPAELHRNDIQLQINGAPRQVTRLIQKNRSLSRVPDLGRHFIISFHNIKAIHPVENTISYFFSEILNSKDSLVLLSPIKAYRIPVTRDREKMKTDVMNILDKDCAAHEKDRNSAEKSLETQLQRLNTIASKQTGDFSVPEPESSAQVLIQNANLATNYKAIYQVLLNFPQNFTRFKNRFLLPDIIKHRQIKDFLGKDQGEKWWIHFQHREDHQIIPKARSAGRKLNAYIATHETGTLAQTMQKSLADLENQLLISDSIPQAEILDSLLGENICYNVVFWGSINTGESGASYKEASGLEAVLRHIAEYSGGKAAVATDPEQGMKEIKNHSDQYYDLMWEYDGNIENKKIHISTEYPNLKISYKKNFSKEDMEEWVRTLTKKKVEIRDFSLHKNAIHFEVDSFSKNQEKRFGILKVRISLFELNDMHVYKSENTLRASKDKVTISIPFPPEYRGEFRLLIEVFDLLANTAASCEHLIELD